MNYTGILVSYIEEIKDNIGSLEENLSKINNGSAANSVMDSLVKIEELIKSIDSDITSLKLEFGNSKLDINKDQNIKSILLKYDQLKSQYNKIKLLNNPNNSNNNNNNNNSNINSNSFTYKDSSGKRITIYSNGSNDSRDRIAKLNKIQENNLKMINDCKREISNMTNCAIDTNIELRRQTEQLKSMEKKFDDIDAQLNQSNNTVDKMLKRWF